MDHLPGGSRHRPAEFIHPCVSDRPLQRKRNGANLSNGQVLLLRKTQDVEEGDIIAFYYNNQVLVRRAICRSGRQISISEDGTVLINNQPIEEDYLTEKSIGQCNIEFPYHVQDGFFVMGDNRVIAMDSRLKEIGVVSTDRIIGKVLLAI